MLNIYDSTSHLLYCSTTSDFFFFFLKKVVFYCPYKFVAPQGNILQEQKMSEAKKNKNLISGRKNYSFCKHDPSVCFFLKNHFVPLYTVYLLCLLHHFAVILYLCGTRWNVYFLCSENNMFYSISISKFYWISISKLLIASNQSCVNVSIHSALTHDKTFQNRP